MNLRVNHLVFCLLYSVGVPFGNGIDPEENEVEKSLTMEGVVSFYQQLVFQLQPVSWHQRQFYDP